MNLLAIPLLIGAVLSATAPFSTASTLYVTPRSYIECPGKPCHTLAEYVQDVSQYFINHTRMVFMSGTHYLEASNAIPLRHITNFSMIGSSSFATLTAGVYTMSESTSIIQCSGTKRSGFGFFGVDHILIENLTIASCGQHLVSRVLASIAFDTAWNVTISRVSIRDSIGFGLHADRVFGNVLITDSIFFNNSGNEYYYGGNARFWYAFCDRLDTNTSVQITSSWFLYGQDPFKYHFYSSATGITIIINCTSIDISITNVTTWGNKAENGGNIAVNLTDYGDNFISISDTIIGSGVAHRGGGLRFWSIVAPLELPCSQPHIILKVTHTQFIGNSANQAGGALYISHYESEMPCTKVIVFENCNFSNSSIPPYGNGAVMQIIKHKLPGYRPRIVPQFKITFESCVFSNNFVRSDIKKAVIGSIMDIFSVERVLLTNCSFENNNSTGVSVVSSNLVFQGNILFEGNTATNGGALKLCDTSVMYIRNNTHIKFIDNHAHKAGGAIYAQQRCAELAFPCFFQPDVDDYTYVANLTKMMSLDFVNNTANYAGSGLYGGAVEDCYTVQHFWYQRRPGYYHSRAIFEAIFNFDNQSSAVSSDPTRVCLCNDLNSDQPDCSIRAHSIHVYPGQLFHLPAVAVGQRNGTVPGIIEVIPISVMVDSTYEIPDQYKLQQARNECTTLKYTLLSNSKEVIFNLTVQQSSPGHESFYYVSPPPSITVIFLTCPWGFQLDNDSLMCDCNRLLKGKSVKCNINVTTVHRHNPVWIGHYKLSGNKTCPPGEESPCEGVLFHSHCPFDYCKPDRVDITINTTDSQCTHNRTGILCGACMKGLSLALGTSRCLHCSNLYLLLLLPFAAAGLLLVFLLVSLNLTVSEGTLNGLIFYANIIQVNRNIFFPQKYISGFYKVLTVFIAWINLDLGIETCFYNGMNTYTKTWLQFAFPVYIWLIAGMIIFLSRRYTIVARLFGKNAVKVLATLFLLSYAKLQRTVITAVSSAYISYSDRPETTVWLSDANVEYLQGKHIPLFLVAFLFAVLTLPYALVLTFIQWLQKIPNIRILFWVQKFKPLFDAYTGPYKDKYCFWTGLLLVIRCFLFTTFAVNVLGTPDLNLTVIALTCFFITTFAWALGGVYKKWTLEVLESSLFFNLGVLSVGSIYVMNCDGNREALTYTSVSVALTTFIGIALYHTWKQAAGSEMYKKAATWISKRRTRKYRNMQEPMLAADELATETPEDKPAPQPTAEQPRQFPVIARYDKYREPVLEYEDQN